MSTELNQDVNEGSSPRSIEDLFYSEKPGSQPGSEPDAPLAKNGANDGVLEDAGGEAEQFAETGDAVAAQEPKSDPGGKKGPRQSWKELRQAKETAEARAALAQREIEELRRQLTAQSKVSAEPVQQAAQETANRAGVLDDGSPDINAYDDLNAYMRARDKWNREQWKREMEESAKVESQRKTEADAMAKRIELETQWNMREAAVRKTMPDYDGFADVAEKAIKDNPAVVLAIFESEVGPQILRHLGQNPTELHALTQKSPHAAVKLVGALEAKLTTQHSNGSGARSLTNAPAPLGSPSRAAVGNGHVKERSLEEIFYGS
mgnify:CR=1 FL=1